MRTASWCWTRARVLESGTHDELIADSSTRYFTWDLEYSEALRKKILPLFEDYKRRSNMYMKKGR
jgi:hypothetical protein